MTRTKRAALLARVSSAGQNRVDKLGIPVQLEAGRAYAERHGFTVAGEFIDAVSGVSESREALYRLLAEAHNFDVVIVFDLTRLSRSEELSFKFLRLFNEAGLEVHSTTRGVLAADVQTGVEILMSSEERRRIWARISAAKHAIAKRGELPDAMQAYGYTHVARKGVVIPKEAELVYRMFRDSADGMTFTRLATVLEEQGIPTPRVARGEAKGTKWSPQTVARIIKNPIYKGEYRWNFGGLSYAIDVPAIVSPELWSAAQKPRRGPPGRLHFPLSGHLYCGLCGARVSSRRSTRRRRPDDKLRTEEFYRCNTVANTTRQASCNLPQFARTRLEPIVDSELRSILSTPEVLRRYLETERPPDPATATERAQLGREDTRWLEAFSAGAISAGELGEYRAGIRAKLRALDVPISNEVQLDYAAYKQAADGMSLAELVEYASVRVTLTPGNVHLELG